VTASGSDLTYQWFKDGTALAGQTDSSLVLNSVTAADAGSYSVTVSGSCGQPVSRSASLTVNQTLVISVVPANATNCPGFTAIFNVAASGTGLAYQWFKGANALPGQTDSTLTLANVTAADAGSYIIVATGICGNSATNSATLTILENLTVVSSPLSLTNCPGTTASFSVTASGSDLTYQWFKDGTALAGQTDSSLVLNSVTAADAGSYSVTVSGS